MALQKREKILAIATGSLLVVFLLVMLLSGGGSSTSTLRLRKKTLLDEIKKQKDTIRSGNSAVEKMAAWQKRSLPSDGKDARSLYQNWLRALVDKAGFQDVKVDSSGGQSRAGIYRMFTFTVHGDATMDQLTRFLFDFYSAGHLHKIRHFSITPIKDSKYLTLAITVEALSMPEADRANALSDEVSKRLELAEVEDYVDAIVKRRLDDEQEPVDGGLFVAYRPPKPPYTPPPPSPEPPKPPEFDPTTQTFLNAVVEVDGRPQVWLFIRSSDETLKYYEGDEFEIGPIRGTVVRIDPRQVELNVRGRSVVLMLGDNLSERLPDDLPDEEADEPDMAEEGAADSPETDMPDEEMPAADMSDEQLNELLDELEAEDAADGSADETPAVEPIDQKAKLDSFLEGNQGDTSGDESDPE